METEKKIEKVLIANRGEIAVRILRTLMEMGIKSAVVYSTVDRDSLAVRLADEAVFIGPAPASESYLDINKVMKAAAEVGADALHPGYGFLAENSGLPKACKKAGITFIGPKSSTMISMGDKLQAKRIAAEAGVPVTPGSDKPVKDIDSARELAAFVGYPIILKAAYGGGGRGMRVVRSDLELENSFHTAQMEVRTAFGDDTLYLERYIDDARHIEFQVLGDGRGRAIHLYERECTIQRRHQKLIEEAPSPFLSENLREEMGAAAVSVAEAVDYTGAGTVEFLCDSKGDYYFIEMNTRIQVEHPVTEAICGIDLIRKQIEIAQCGEIGIEQENVRPKGWAIECRINAEDPLRDFLPGPGEVRFVHFPSGQGVRVDSQIYPGYIIPRQYDSLIAKIIAHGEDRGGAIKKMIRALDELAIEGVSTTTIFHKRVLTDPEFIAGNFSTNYVESNTERLTEKGMSDNEVAAIASALEVYLYTRRSTPRLNEKDATADSLNPWRVAARRAAIEGLFSRE